MPPIKRTVSRRNTIRSLPSRVIRRPSFPSEIIDIIHQRDGSVDKNWFLPSKIHGSFHEETGNASCLFFFHPGKSSRTSICLIFLFSSMNLKTNPLPIGKALSGFDGTSTFKSGYALEGWIMQLKHELKTGISAPKWPWMRLLSGFPPRFAPWIIFHNLLRGLRLRGSLVFYKKFLDN